MTCPAICLRDDETCNPGTAGHRIRLGAVFRDYGKRPTPANINGQFALGIGDSGRKALLINRPQNIEILFLEVSEVEFHGPL